MYAGLKGVVLDFTEGGNDTRVSRRNAGHAGETDHDQTCKGDKLLAVEFPDRAHLDSAVFGVFLRLKAKAHKECDDHDQADYKKCQSVVSFLKVNMLYVLFFYLVYIALACPASRPVE